MTEIYIAFVDTPGIFASIIRRVIKQKYIHVAIGLDENLDEAYSIGRRHPSIPLIAGFEKEEKRKILRAFPGADYMICSIPCTQEQKQFIKEELHEAMKKTDIAIIIQFSDFRFYFSENRFIKKIITHVLPMLPSCLKRQASVHGTSIFRLLRQRIFMNIRGNRKFLKVV